MGLETALFVAAKGTLTPDVLHFLMAYDAMPPDRLKDLMFAGTSSVTVFEMLDKAGTDVGKSTRWILMDRLSRYGVEVKTGATVLSIGDDEMVWEQDGSEHAGRFDSVILASGSVSEQHLATAMADAGIPHTIVGDGIKPGRLNHAIHGGFLAGMDL